MSLSRQLTAITFKYSTSSILSTPELCNSTVKIKQIHSHLIITGRIRDTFIATKLVELCAISAGDIDYACRIFEQIENPNSYSWTTMMRGFSDARNPEKVIQFYGEMRSKGVEPNRFTFLFVLKAYAFKRCHFDGRIVHGKVLKMGVDSDLFICNGLIHVYSKCEDISSALKLFDEMPSKSMVNYNTLVTACFNCGDVENGRGLFDKMPERNVESWNAVIAGYCKLGHVDIAKSLFDMMGQRDLVSWASMLSGYVHSGRTVEALELFKGMQFIGIRPDGVTLTSVLSACAQIGALDMGKWIHAYVNENNLRNDIHLGTSLVDMYAKCGSIDIAMQLFDAMCEKNICTWNAILLGLSFHGHGHAALELFKQMEYLGLVPNDITFVAVLSACSHVGATDEGQKQFKRMVKEFNIMPKIEHYGCMVDILGRRGLIEEAKELIKIMPMEPNIVIWGSLLNACKIHGYTEIDRDIEVHLHSLASQDGGSHVLLSNIYAAKNDWSSVENLRKMIRAHGFEKKTPGCSSIEVNSVVQEFFSEDRSNSNWIQMNEVIERLRTHLESEGYELNTSWI
ncbi:hypothetical protein Ancab_024206 [Ancistrocladus abbreviatus]